MADLLTVREAATLLGVTPNAVQHAAARGTLTPAMRAHGRLVFWRAEIERYQATMARPRKERTNGAA